MKDKEKIRLVSDFSMKRKKDRESHPAVEIKNLVIDFGETLAVDGIDFSIEKGELVTLLGPSGCGKTTTLNAIAGLLSPTSGDIMFNGLNVTKLSPQKRKLGLVFQNYALYPHMSVYKNIAFPLTNDELWKWSVKKRNMIAKNEIEIIKLKAAKAPAVEVEKLNRRFDRTVSVAIEVNTYLKDLTAKKDKEIKVASNQIALLKTKAASNIAKLNKGALDLIVKKESDQKNKLFILKSKAEGNHEIKAEFKVLKSQLKKELVDFSNKEKLRVRDETILIKQKLSQDVELAKQNYKDVKEKTSIEQAQLRKDIAEAKSNKRALPRKAIKDYKTTLDRLKKEYTDVKLTEAQQKKVDELSERIISYKTAIHIAVMEVAEKVDIVKNLKKKPTKLSGGQQQRVAIARGIVKKPKILLMDEPLSNLDAKLRISTREWIKSIVTSLGMTTIFVTHDQEEAMSISDKIVCMSNGEVQQVGSPMELYNNPKNEFVAQFLGMPEMKVFKASVNKTGTATINGVPIIKDKKLVGLDKVSLGVRAEHIKETTGKGVQATIKDVEYLGKDILATVEYEDHGIGKAFLSKKEHYKVGEKVKLLFPEKKLYLFNRKGNRI